ncbi:MAG: hypothetical protein ACREUG_01005 [Steroidobacteraceae bacterium]
MKKNPLALTDYSRTMKAANDDGASGASGVMHPPTIASTRTSSQRSGWDPFEVWHTRIRQRADRDTRLD